ncbi:MAG: hypothetical protein RJA22_2457 [Verrucomicrobiota bacterium]
MEGGEHKAGWLDPLRRMGDSILALVQNRFELAGVELQEEKLRTLSLLVWLSAAIALGTAGLLLGLGALALFLWAKAGYAGLVGLALVTLAAAGGILQSIRRRLFTGPMPFAGTVAEFKKDRDCLRPKP